MNELIEAVGMGNAVIGGADGPTSIFLAGSGPDMVTMIIAIVVGLLICFFGLKIARVLVGIVGFCIGAAVGIGVVALTGPEGMVALAVVLGCAIALAVLSVVLYRFGVFCLTFLYSISFGTLLVCGMSTSVVIGTSTMIGMGIVLVVALILAILSAIFVDPLIIIVTALSGGMTVGNMVSQVAGLNHIGWAGYVIGAVVALVGMGTQFMMQSRKIGKKEKVFSDEIKEKDSVESEVEKARIILDLDDEEKEEDDEA